MKGVLDLLARLVPSNALRIRLQRAKGVKIGQNVYLGYDTHIDTAYPDLIEIEDHVIRIGQHLYLEDAGRFVPVAEHVFPRRSSGAYMLPRGERVVQADIESDSTQGREDAKARSRLI